MGEKILVVDDDPAIVKLITKVLASKQYTVLSADNGLSALDIIKKEVPDLVVSDAQMPGLDGHSLCRALRKEKASGSVPLILISGAWTQEANVLAGFEGGADDYILKPLSMPLLLARIEAVLRRYKKTGDADGEFKKYGLVLDQEGRSVSVRGQRLRLTRKEFDLLALLAGKPNRVFSVPYLLETVWGYDPADYNDPSTVEAHISRLRKKCGPEIAACLINVTGHGYKFETQE